MSAYDGWCLWVRRYEWQPTHGNLVFKHHSIGWALLRLSGCTRVEGLGGLRWPASAYGSAPTAQLPCLWQPSPHALIQWQITSPHGPYSSNSVSDLFALVTPQKAPPPHALAFWIWKYEFEEKQHSKGGSRPIYRGNKPTFLLFLAFFLYHIPLWRRNFKAFHCLDFCLEN